METVKKYHYFLNLCRLRIDNELRKKDWEMGNQLIAIL